MMIGYLGNSYLPARIGEFLRAYALGKKTDLSPVLIFSTGLVESIRHLLSGRAQSGLPCNFLVSSGRFLPGYAKILILLTAFLIMRNARGEVRAARPLPHCRDCR
jgi:hypothetical protein